MNPTADLDKSLAFVIGRIEEEATRSGQPLSDDHRFLAQPFTEEFNVAHLERR